MGVKRIFIGLLIAAGIIYNNAYATDHTITAATGSAVENLRVTFLKDTVIQSGNSFSFNTITIVNTGSTVQEFTVDSELPEGWQQVFDSRKVFQLKPNEPLTLPIRIAATPSSGSTIYPILINLRTAGMNEKLTRSFYAKVNQNSSWKADLRTPDLKLLRDNKETFFQVELSNQGNQAEELNLNFNTNLDLTVPNRNNRIILRPKQDTIIAIGIITELRYLQEFKPQEIGISITNKAGNLKLLSQKVYSWGTIFKENPSQWYNIPLAVEMISQNVTNSRKSVYMTGSGNIALSNNRSVSFNYRSDNFYSANAGGSRYANINYNSPLWKLSFGDQTEFSNFLLDGPGVRANYTGSGKYSFNLLGIKSRLGDARQGSLTQTLDIGNGQVINNQSYVNLDQITGTNSYSSIMEYEKYFKNTHLSFEGGLSTEQNKLNASLKTLSGHVAGFKFDHNSQKLMIRSYSSINSKGFSGINRGLALSNNEIRLKYKKTFAGVLYEFNERSVTRIDSNKVNSLFSGRIDEYGVRLGYNAQGHYVNLKATIVNQLQDSLNNMTFQSQKINLNTALTMFKNLQISLDANVARTYSTSVSTVEPFISTNIFGTFQFKGLGMFLRYEDGPFYYYDLRSYVNDGLRIRRAQLTPFLETSLFNSAINSRVQLDYSTDILTKITSSVVRADLNVNLVKQALTLRVFGSYDLKPTAVNKQNILSVSIRKNFGLPVVGLQKFRNLKVVLYKDKNLNENYDSGDEAVSDGNLQIGNQYLITNKKGEVYYKNIPAGKYSIDLSQINNVKGWVARDGFKQNIDVKTNETVYIPFKESKFLSGRLNVVRDQYSKVSFNPGNIRITAINSKGESFYTLTNSNGEFFLNLPAETYVIQINTNVFSDNFRVLQETFNADLIQKSDENIVFEIRESKRQINIQRQGIPVKP